MQYFRIARRKTPEDGENKAFRARRFGFLMPMVTVLDGTGKFTVGGKEYILNKGETLIMPKGILHAVFGIERFKMQLIVSF